MKQHAIESYPNESCGLLIKKGKKTQYIRCHNTSNNPSEHFKITAEQFADIEDNGEVVGVVHSHPDGNAELSQADHLSMNNSGYPWTIISVGAEGVHQVKTHKPDNWKAPLIGRGFFFGVLDCYTLIRDYYQRELNIDLPDFERTEGFWQRGENLYMDNFTKAGFVEVTDGSLKQHDVLLMNIHSKIVNHGAIYLGDYKLQSEDCIYQPDSILQHLHGRLSGKTEYSTFYRHATRKVVRYLAKI